MSLSQQATCHILSGHKKSTSLFEAVGGMGQKRWRPKKWQKRWLQKEWDKKGDRKGGCSRDRWEDKSKIQRNRKRAEFSWGNGWGFSREEKRERKTRIEEFFWESWGKEYVWNCSRKLRTEERRVAGKSPEHGAEKGDFQVWPFVFLYIFHFFHTV